MKLNKTSGVSLIEVMGSAFILIIALGALLAVFLQSMTAAKRAECTYNAYAIARNQVERLKALDFGSLAAAAETGTAVNQLGDSDPNGDYARSTTIAPGYSGYANLTQVTVSVYYTFQGVQRPSPVEITTVIYDG
ncbi:MAG: hypothetical protein HY593_00405 [Candidatus Omnitrophica bacterium]|nr:hypothetical protein [Candidatus Omnitrophota bacterium]